MNETASSPSTDYPFESLDLELPDGRMRYVDQGSGPAVVLLHGTPTWSFLYRHLIGALSTDHRVIAPDHLGFGRSDKPAEAEYGPEAHARNLARLIEHLDLREFTLGVHDFGGPIGMSYALEHPDRVSGLILFNTWMWSLKGTRAERVSRLLGGRLGRLLYTRLNFSPRVLLKAAFGDRSALTPEIHARYLEPFPTPDDRIAPWVFARELAGASEWYARLWARRQQLASTPALVLWGMKDPAFTPDDLARWRTVLPDARVVEFEQAGHFVQEEAPDRVEREVRSFLDGR